MYKQNGVVDYNFVPNIEFTLKKKYYVLIIFDSEYTDHC
jgi:hypothetical protein